MLNKASELPFSSQLGVALTGRVDGLRIGEPFTAQREVVFGASLNSTPTLQGLATTSPESERADFINKPVNLSFTERLQSAVKDAEEIKAVVIEKMQDQL